MELGWLSSPRSWGKSPVLGGGVGWGGVRKQAELRKVFWSRMDYLLSILPSTVPSLEWGCVCVYTRVRTSLYDVQGGRAGGETQMARSQLWKHNGGLAGQAHFLTHLETSPHYGLFEIRGQGPRVRQPVSSE